jgi:hypothetical protein
MKVFSIALAVTALAVSASAGAQITGVRLPTPTTSTSRGTSVDGSWYVVGRDANGDTIYERRTTDNFGNVVIQRARRNANGGMTIISSRTVNNANDRRSRNCDYNRTTNSVGDIIFGRTSNVNCDDNGNRIDGGWYQVGRGRDNNSIYERRTRDANGNLVIQRARRNPNGTFTIFSTRIANDNDKQWRKEQKRREKELRKEQKRENKEWNKSNRGDDDDDDRYSSRSDDRYDHGSSRSNGHGKSKGKGRD